MIKLLTAFCLLLHFNLAAQQAPWSIAAASIIDPMDLNDKPRSLYLKMDTLYNMNTAPFEPDPAIRASIRNWYNGPDKIGFGYTDAEGNPLGIWKYFRQTSKGYELFCEGSYIALAPKNLVITEAMKDRLSPNFPDSQKLQYINFSVARWLFTGEWRFYREGRLSSIIALDDLLDMHLEEVQLEDRAMITMSGDRFNGKIRMAGHLLTGIYFYPDGKVQRIEGPISLELDKQGKAKIEPLLSPYNSN